MARESENNQNDWIEHKRLILQNQEDNREFQDDMRIAIADLSKRVDDAHNEIKWLRERIVYVTGGIGALIGAIWGIITQNWERIFK